MLEIATLLWFLRVVELSLKTYTNLLTTIKTGNRNLINFLLCNFLCYQICSVDRRPNHICVVHQHRISCVFMVLESKVFDQRCDANFWLNHSKSHSDAVPRAVTERQEGKMRTFLYLFRCESFGIKTLRIVIIPRIMMNCVSGNHECDSFLNY